MWVVRLALARPYTIVVMALLIALGGRYAVKQTSTDIFPNIDIPVISVMWNYAGLPPEEMEKRITNGFERFLTTIVSDIDHVDSQTLTGSAIIKVYLQPGASTDQAIAQITALGQSSLRQMPVGVTPPLIVKYSATSVPIMMLALETDTLSEQQLFDVGFNFVRAEIATIKGAQIPYPYGGKQRFVMVDLDPSRLQATGLSPRDVQNALVAQNVIVPSGTVKVGANEMPVIIASTPETIDELAGLPIKTVAGRTVYIRDVASVRDGNMPQTNLVHVSGHRSVLMPIMKNGDASTLDVTDAIKSAIPDALDRLPAEARGHLTVKMLFDQSVFVRASVDNVLHEGLIAAGLTALLILVFLGSWRSTLVVITSIPLSILFAVIVLHALGETLNVMTLGGLALAVGVLVDDATVEVENVHRNLARNRRNFVQALLDGAQQIAFPALVSTLAICIVFVPIAFLSGAARSLFVPLGLAVGCAMLMSYALSRTLVPVMIRALLEHEGHRRPRFAASFDRAFARLRTRYGRLLAWLLQHRRFALVTFVGFVAFSFAVVGPMLGRDFFPTVDAGLIKLHVRAAPGTRIEETEKRILQIERDIRAIIPVDETDTILDIIGQPYSSINLALSEGALISPADAQILVSLKPGHGATDSYVRAMREALTRGYPDTTFFFLAPDITTQVLNFGLAAPIDLQVVGPIGSEDKTSAFAQQLAQRVSKVPGAVDVHLSQVAKVPTLTVAIDRTEAQQAGLSERDVATDLLVSLSSSGQIAPTYWLDKRGVQYIVNVQTPQYAIPSVEALASTPISTGTSPTQTLGNLAHITRGTSAANITHYNVARTWDVVANLDGTDLGSVVDRVRDIQADMMVKPPPGTRIVLKGQAESMDSSFGGLRSGLVLAIALVYLLMVVNFQSWIDPLIILTALPGALAGIVWILFVTGTTLSVPALIGSIMCVGVATANSILVVSFANDQRRGGRLDARHAALAAGMTRLRPVLMTALAMIFGMLPMATGLGEGGEQNAPLGRAVIGGLVLATVTTLFVVPVIYSLLRRKQP